MDHLAVVQGFGWLQYLMGHLRCEDGMGTLIKMLVEFTQLECGCLVLVFELDYEEYMITILTRNWVMEISTLFDSLWEWTTKAGHNRQEWFFDRSRNNLYYRCSEEWWQFPAVQIMRL
jgi:hypothetical protein